MPLNLFVFMYMNDLYANKGSESIIYDNKGKKIIFFADKYFFWDGYRKCFSMLKRLQGIVAYWSIFSDVFIKSISSFLNNTFF